MQKKFIAAVSAVCVFAAPACGALASDALSFVSRYNSETDVLQLEGSGSGYITVRIAPDDIEAKDFSVSNPPIVFDKIYANGKFVYECQLPDGTPGGGYNIYLTDNSVTVTDSFRYFILEEANEIIRSGGGINDALKNKDYQSFKNLLEQNAEKLGIDSKDELFAESSGDITRLMYDMNGSFADAADLYNKYCLAYAVIDMKNADRKKVEDVLAKYETYLGIDADKDYYEEYRLSDAAKAALCTLLADSDTADALADGNSFEDVFETLKAVASVKSAEKWQDIAKAMTDTFKDKYAFVFEKNNDYTKLSSLTSVYSKMMSGAGKVKALADVQGLFDKAADDVINSKTQSSSKGSGGGGGFVSMPKEDILPEVQAPVVSALQNPFADVDKDFWGYNAIVEMSAQKLVAGYEDKTFRPNQTITRAEFVKILCAMAKLEEAEADFEDVSADSWYAPYVGAAQKSGIVSGDGNRFNPNAPITRQDTATIIYRLLSDKNADITQNAKTFLDEASVADYAKAAVSTLGGLGVINGTGGGSFEPLLNLTRAEAVQMLFNAAEYIR